MTDNAEVEQISPSRRQPATGADVAELAGVSKSAVSRAFSGGRISEATRKRIFDAADRLRYRPSRSASSLTTNRSGLIGVAVTHLDNHFYPEVLETLAGRLDESGHRILLFITDDHSRYDPVLDELLRFRVDALLLASSSLSADLALECQEAGIPAIMFNTADEFGRVRSVIGADVAGPRTIAAFLLASDHRRLAYISGLEESSTSTWRGTSFAGYLREHGLPLFAEESGRFTFEGAAEAARTLLSRSERPDAIFCANDHMAFAVLQIARSEFGIDVGRKLSIIGFGDVNIASWPEFALTTFEQPTARMIDSVVEHLNAVLQGHAVLPGNTVVPGDLIVRSTARRPSTGVQRRADGLEVWRQGE